MKLFESEAAEDEVEKALNYLTSMPQNEQFLQSVKNSGKKLCRDLSPDKREIRINEMVSEVTDSWLLIWSWRKISIKEVRFYE